MAIKLLDTPPIAVDEALAIALKSLDEAAIVTKIHQWCEFNRKNKSERHYQDGHYWTYDSVENWYNKHFLFISSLRTLQRMLKKLRDENILITGNYNPKKYDQTLWYRVNYEQLEKMSIQEQESLDTIHSPKNETPLGQNGTMDNDKMAQCKATKCHNGDGQNGTMDNDKMAQPIPIYKQYINNNIINHSLNQENVILENNKEERVSERDTKKINLDFDFFKTNFSYDKFSKDEKSKLDIWINWIVDICSKTKSECIRVGGKQTTTKEVQERFVSLRYEHVKYVFECLANLQTDKVNPKGYILTCLYNAIDKYAEKQALDVPKNIKQRSLPTGRYQAPTPAYVEERLKNLSNSIPKERKVDTEEAKQAYQRMLAELNKNEKRINTQKNTTPQQEEFNTQEDELALQKMISSVRL